MIRSRNILYRPLWLTLGSLMLLLIIALVLLLITSWRGVNRTEPIHHHLAVIEAIQFYNLQLLTLTNQIQAGKLLTSLEKPPRLYTSLQTLSVSKHILGEETSILINHAAKILRHAKFNSMKELEPALNDLRMAQRNETIAQNHLLRLIKRDNRLELEIATLIAVSFPVLGVFIFYFLRNRILSPLNDLRCFMDQLAQQEFCEVPINNVDPLLKPLFLNFNYMVQRLVNFEQMQRNYRQHLEHEVHHATQALLISQQTLARTERLAAIGEMAASLAHELRNPLAGIYVTLVNLHNESNIPNVTYRLDLVVNELNRVNKMLRQILTQARHTPETPSTIPLSELVDSLCDLMQYQIPTTITIQSKIPTDIRCTLPPNQLRQVLMNLVLNASQAVVDKTGIITINAKYVNQQLEILICDDGPGFPPALINNGIQPFATWRKEGTGLGLSMVHRFCQDQGGQIILHNQKTQGACVQLILPHP